MSAAPLPIQSSLRNRKPKRSQRKRQAHSLNPQVSSTTSRQDTVKKLIPPSKNLPPQVRFMLQLQQVSSVIALGLIATTLGVYAWTVYTPKIWSREYQDLEKLQRYERHLTAANESIKNQLARQAENPAMGLKNPHPAQAIFLPKTAEPNLASTESTTTETETPLVSSPISY